MWLFESGYLHRKARRTIPHLHTYYYLPVLRLKALTAIPDFYINSGDSNSGLCTCVADTLPMEPSPQSSDVCVCSCVCMHVIICYGMYMEVKGQPRTFVLAFLLLCLKLGPSVLCFWVSLASWSRSLQRFSGSSPISL